MKIDYDYLDGKFSEAHVFSYQDVAYCMDIAREPLKKDLDTAIELIKESRKFMDRLPSEWFPEWLVAKQDDLLSKLRSEL